MSIEAFVTLFLGGLVACYWAGLKLGAIVTAFKNLGRSA